MARMMTLIWAILLTAGCALAQTTGPAALTKDSSVDQILDALDHRGGTLKDFTAKVRMAETDTSTGDEKIWSGRIWFKKDAQVHDKIRVDFDQKTQDDKIVKGEHIEYTLKDGVLIDRNYKTRKQVSRRVLKPGQKVNLFKIGGPFPLPLGQDKEDVKREFLVKRIDSAKDDPANTVRLRLEPHKGTDMARRFKSIEIVIDPQSNMPVLISATNANETETKTTTLTELRLNGDVKDADFDLPPISGWDQIDEEYRG